MSEDTSVSSLDLTNLGEVIGDAVASGLAKHAPPKKVTFGEYARRENRGRSKLRRDCFQNGFRMDAVNLSNTEIDLLNALNRTGRYINRLIEVIVGQEGADESVELQWKCKTADDRFEIVKFARTFEDMLTQIVEAQKTENEQDDERALDRATTPKTRHFGDTKATREAREKAGV